MPSHIRIFPHSHDEFPSEDSLLTWLLTALRARGGVYHLRSADAVKELPPGSIVLFRYGHHVVGEAIVQKGKEIYQQKLSVPKVHGGAAEYEAQVTFVPCSIRLYAPPLSIDVLEQYSDKNLRQFPGAYCILNWDVYPKILEQISQGTLVL